MSTLKRWNGSSYVDLATFKRWNGSAWVDITTAKRWDGATWQTITLPGGGGGGLSATASDGLLTKVSSSGEACPEITSQSTTITATGGTGPYTYAWSRVSGDSAILVTNATSATTDFYANICFGTRDAVWRCTVTDSLSATTTVDVTISLTK